MRKLEQIQTKEYIAGILRNEILSGRLAPDEELAQEKLAELLGVSRMPVREALQTLETEGYLERMSNRHMKVIRLDGRKIRESFFFLAQAELSVFRLLRQQAENDEELMKAVEKALAAPAGHEEMEFHLRAAELLDNAYIRKTFEKLLGGYAAYVIREVPHREPECLAELGKPWRAGNMEAVSQILNTYYEELADCLQQAFVRNRAEADASQTTDEEG